MLKKRAFQLVNNIPFFQCCMDRMAVWGKGSKQTWFDSINYLTYLGLLVKHKYRGKVPTLYHVPSYTIRVLRLANKRAALRKPPLTISNKAAYVAVHGQAEADRVFCDKRTQSKEYRAIRTLLEQALYNT